MFEREVIPSPRWQRNSRQLRSPSIALRIMLGTGVVPRFEASNQAEIRNNLQSMFRGVLIATPETFLEDAVKELVGAKRDERMDTRKGYRCGPYVRGLRPIESFPISVPKINYSFASSSLDGDGQL
jgi:hypothetical protein